MGDGAVRSTRLCLLIHGPGPVRHRCCNVDPTQIQNQFVLAVSYHVRGIALLSVTMTTFDSHYFFAAEEEGLPNFYNVF